MASIIQGDARDLSHIEDGSIHCYVTSPPYWGRRSYGDDPEEVGRGLLDDYVVALRDAMREVYKKLNERGLAWLNIGDTSSRSGGAGGDHNRGGSKEALVKYRQGDSGLPRMTWCLAPSRIALALQEDGWLIRQWITWDKGQVKPEDISHARRPLEASETILMLAKHPKHRYYYEAHSEHGIEIGNVWHFPPRRGSRVHQAPFPHELPRRCILLSTKAGDHVLDSFAGSGTTLEVAESLGRVAHGVDLYAPGATEEEGEVA